MINPWGNNCTLCNGPTFSQVKTICYRHEGDLPLPETVIHIAGPCGQHGDHVRQRCSWCGDLLLSYRPSMMESKDHPNPWPIRTWVGMSNGASWAVVRTIYVPDDACFKPLDMDTSDFDRYCTEHKVPLGKESEAFSEWLKEIVVIAIRRTHG